MYVLLASAVLGNVPIAHICVNYYKELVMLSCTVGSFNLSSPTSKIEIFCCPTPDILWTQGAGGWTQGAGGSFYMQIVSQMNSGLCSLMHNKHHETTAQADI